ncbi:MAG: glutathione S-transferase family protein [Thermoleophilaceae bacterium]|nr:glutathione S-transferase family protein [Thermoleophilaceae bacterium]
MVRLFRAPWSTNVERVALALAHKGVEVESVTISYEDRSAVEAVSGQGLVPVLDDDGVIVSDSTRILRHLEATRPDPPLFPRDAARRAEMDVFLEWFNEVWKGPPNAIEEALETDDPGLAAVAVHARRLDAWLDLFDAMLDGRPYLFGDFSAADCAAFPFLKFPLLRDPADDELFHRLLAEYQSLAGRPRLAAWIERVDAHPRV